MDKVQKTISSQPCIYAYREYMSCMLVYSLCGLFIVHFS
jgi:hypothetical protein